jgi:hypothetical protein
VITVDSCWDGNFLNAGTNELQYGPWWYWRRVLRRGQDKALRKISPGKYLEIRHRKDGNTELSLRA